MAADKVYTVMIVPERSSKVRRLKVPQSLLTRVAVGGIAALSLLGFFMVHYFFIIDQAAENVALKEDNVQLKTSLRVMQDEIARIDQTLQRVDQFATRVRAITQLNDPDRNLAIGPLSNDPNAKTPEVLYAKGERIDYEDEVIDSKMAMRMIDSNAEALDSEATKLEDNVRQLRDYFVDQDALLATTPSIRPVPSKLMTSTFGERKDAYTDQEVIHKGVDFAADSGTAVVAPADGVVVFAGNRGNGYGTTVVLDHGFGIQTHFAHLANFTVHLGDHVRRGQAIAAVGNTGRTMGAHLHYEVRFDGIPQDPEKFILD